ncbi:DUF5987 family protein [Streptomyces sp. NPDC004787]|uniref:DUF5987 family protein n=1 Tax=Streptomyces sp. NPDC004787 TaxID=3154291 RepID=UPI0033B54D00
MTDFDRRTILKAITATLAVLTAGNAGASPAVGSETGAGETWTDQTLLAFADTLIPGQRRYPGDLVVAGAVTGPGAAQAGVIPLLTSPQLPLRPALPSIAALLDARAVTYAAARFLWLSPVRPPFVGLPFSHRTTLVQGLFGTHDVDRPIWQSLSLLVSLAFDTAATHDTRQALEQQHPGLTWIDFPQPNADGTWRFSDFSYQRPLAMRHPSTTPSGHPA